MKHLYIQLRMVWGDRSNGYQRLGATLKEVLHCLCEGGAANDATISIEVCVLGGCGLGRRHNLYRCVSIYTANVIITLTKATLFEPRIPAT